MNICQNPKYNAITYLNRRNRSKIKKPPNQRPEEKL